MRPTRRQDVAQALRMRHQHARALDFQGVRRTSREGLGRSAAEQDRALAQRLYMARTRAERFAQSRDLRR